MNYLTITNSRKIIMKALSDKGVYQFRHYIIRNSKGTKTERNKHMKTACLQLNKEKVLRITGRRMFSSAGISGINYTLIKEPD